MYHVAVMKKSWGLIPKILSGVKKAESRWYKTKRAPWDKVTPGDTLYFKDSGEPVTVKARVTKVLQFQVKDNKQALKIMRKFAIADLGLNRIPIEVSKYTKDKNYAILIFFDSVEKIKPFKIDKSGFGNQCAWIMVKDISEIKKRKTSGCQILLSV